MTAAASIDSGPRGGGLRRIRRARVDLIGLGALIIAGLGLAGTIVMIQTPPAERHTTPGVPEAVAPTVPARDQWYLDASRQAPTAADPGAASTGISAQADGTFARDRWYLEGRTEDHP